MVMDGNSSWGGDDLAEYVGGELWCCMKGDPTSPS